MVDAQVCVGVAFVITCTSMIAINISNRRLSSKSYNELIDLLQPTDMPGVALVAIEALNPHHTVLVSSPEQRLAFVGGMRGIWRLRANANILLALASHAERWDITESKRAARVIRNQGVALRRAAWMMMICGMVRFTWGHPASYVQRIAVSYYQMTEAVLPLYNQLHASDKQPLDAVIWRLSPQS